MRVYAQTDVGKVRPLNEDAFYLPRPGERFCAVADGMGGHNAGEVASAMAVQLFSGELRDCRILHGMAMRRAVEAANAAIHAHAAEDEALSGMGTTFTGLAEQGGNIHIAHVGDSRCYLIRNGSIMRLTLDHTLVEEMVLQGLISPREAKHHPKRNYITRALGTAPRVEVDLIQVEKREGDIFFLCTDGLTNHVEESAILEVTLGGGSWTERLHTLIDYALQSGGSDNITAMYAVIGEDSV